ncbi:unnamed protein product [Malus baccata var. baccata]
MLTSTDQSRVSTSRMLLKRLENLCCCHGHSLHRHLSCSSQPSIFAQPVSLEGFELVGFPVIKLNISIGILVTVKNPNYGGFKYENSTVHISYRGNVVAEAPIRDDTVPARSTHNITSVVSILADKLVTNSHFSGDMAVGVLNFTSETTLHGKVNLLKVFKMKATSYSDCNISIYHYWNPERRLRLQIEGKTR